MKEGLKYVRIYHFLMTIWIYLNILSQCYTPMIHCCHMFVAINSEIPLDMMIFRPIQCYSFLVGQSVGWYQWYTGSNFDWLRFIVTRHEFLGGGTASDMYLCQALISSANPAPVPYESLILRLKTSLFKTPLPSPTKYLLASADMTSLNHIDQLRSVKQHFMWLDRLEIDSREHSL